MIIRNMVCFRLYSKTDQVNNILIICQLRILDIMVEFTVRLLEKLFDFDDANFNRLSRLMTVSMHAIETSIYFAPDGDIYNGVKWKFRDLKSYKKAKG